MKTANLLWVIEETSLAKELNINASRFTLINDMETIARAVPILRPSDVHHQCQRTRSHGTIAVIAPIAIELCGLMMLNARCLACLIAFVLSYRPAHVRHFADDDMATIAPSELPERTNRESGTPQTTATKQIKDQVRSEDVSIRG